MGRSKQGIEQGLDLAAAAVLAGAVGFSAFELWHAIALTCGAAAFAFAASAWLLGKVAAERHGFALSDFDLKALEFDDPGELLLTEQIELVLTDSDRLRTPAPADELVLDDILEQLGPQSRVVSLFGRLATPTPGQLNARIERHLAGAEQPSAPDASAALYEALTELRRSLR